MANLTYVTGDATRPIGDGPKVICHCVNDIGHFRGARDCFGPGFARAVMMRWSKVRSDYLAWYISGSTLDNGVETMFQLGQVQFVRVEPTTWVANIIGQHRTIATGGRIPIRYDAIETGLQTVAAFCQAEKASVVMPRMGAGLARGHWPTIEAIVRKTLVDCGINVTVYDLGSK